MANVKVNVHHLTRVEGHGNIVVDVVNGQLKQCDLQIVETPRFFEAMLRGKPYQNASHITSRICGICAVGHATASLRASEAALGVELSEQTKLLRRLNFLGELLDSHVLHAYMLVAPDFLGAPSVIPLANTAPDVVLRALRMKKLAGDLCQAIAGRHTHPIAMVVGGFTHFPTTNQLYDLRERFEAAREDVVATADLFQTLKLPQFERETEYIALRRDDGVYGFIDGDIVSTDNGRWPASAYQSVTNEYLVPHSSAKHTQNQRESYMVGALARFNVNHDLLHPVAKEVAAALGLKPKATNPYLITVAQVVEIAHCVEEAIQLIDALLEMEIAWEDPALPTRQSGEGVGACEVPRGTLFHHYTIEAGTIVGANCIIPTGQNLANIELDMKALVPTLLDRTQQQITHSLEMLVRAYDPCISCSTHLLDVKFE
ncbi:MAG: Ni/Fe hydrogenase subunit alpha [Ardenticatenaceae bacterium]|nr:Ni/Fe hydrogenase subunit alpha [Anaerolineales bacterium]MCB8976092.1 Ni/Fe hydrogenase subunit alpha [Ardenticatenaceae bacterium]